jgi:hypothetical protein
LITSFNTLLKKGIMKIAITVWTETQIKRRYDYFLHCSKHLII